MPSVRITAGVSLGLRYLTLAPRLDDYSLNTTGLGIGRAHTGQPCEFDYVLGDGLGNNWELLIVGTSGFNFDF